MSNIDDRVVSIQFDNRNFEQRLAATIESLDKLSKSIEMVGAKQGFSDLSSAADHFDLSSMAESVDSISSKFSAMGAIGFSAIQQLTQSVVNFISNTGQDILEPILTGGKRRAVNIEQAKFMFAGLGIDIQQGMDSALAAVRGTAFGLDEAAKAAAQFGASGIEVGDQMTGALRGVAGAAAMTGTSFTEMADIFAGSAGSGRVTNMDLMQFATRGLNAAAAVGKVMGKTEAQIHQMATDGTLDFKTFAAAMDEAFGKHATQANETYTGSLANLHAAMSRLGAAAIGPRLEQERDIFNALSPVIDNVTAALKPMIDTMTWITRVGANKTISFLNNIDLTNFTAAIPNLAAGFANIIGSLQDISGLIGKAFRDIFPKSETSHLIAFSEAFLKFAQKLKMGESGLEKVHRIFRAFFELIDIGVEIVKGFAHLIGGALSSIAPVGGGIADIALKAVDMIDKLHQQLIDFQGIDRFFSGLTEAIKKPIPFLEDLKNKIVGFFQGLFGSGGGNGDKIEQGLGASEQGMNRLSQRLQMFRDDWDSFTDHLKAVFGILDSIWEELKSFFSNLGSKIADAFKPGDFNNAVDVVNVGLLGGIALAIQQFLDSGLLKALGGNVWDKINGILTETKNTLKTMQTEIKADTILKIAEAMGILTASIVVLSLIDSASLTKALTAISVGFGELIGTFTAMDRLVGSAGAASKLAIVGGALILFSGALVTLSVAVKIFSTMDMGSLAKGLVGVGVGMVILAGGTQLIAADTAGLITAGIAMSAISTALIILSVAVSKFADISWADLGKGLVGVAGGLLLVTTALNFMPPSGAIGAIGLIELSAGLIVLAQAVKSFSTIGWAEMGKGLVGITGALIILTAALDAMPITAPITATGILILSAALIVLAEAVKKMGDIDFGTMAKGIGGLTVVLLVLSAAMASMEGAIPGAAALVIVSLALTTLVGVLKDLGTMQVGDLVQGLIAVAGVLVVLGIAAALMTPVIPALAALGVAIGLVGGAFALFGVGAFLVAKAFETMAKAGVAGAQAMVDALKILLTALPDIVDAIVNSLFKMAQDMLDGIPLLIRVVGAIIEALLEEIIKLAPKFGDAGVVLIKELLKAIRGTSPDWIQTGFQMLTDFLTGLRDNSGQIAGLVADIITNFINALSDHVPELADAIYNFILTVLEEIARKLGESQTAFIPIGAAFIDGLITGFETTMPGVIDFFTSLPGNIIGWIGDVNSWLSGPGIDLITGFLAGIGEKALDVIDWFGSLPGNIVSWIPDILSTLIPKGIDLIAGFIKGIIEKADDLMVWAFGFPGEIIKWLGDASQWLIDVGKAVIRGLWDGILSMKDWFLGKISDAAGWVTGQFGDTLKVKSPSRVMHELGVYVMQGLVMGMNSMRDSVRSASSSIGTDIIDNFKKEDVFNSLNSLFNKALESLSSMDEFNPTITPVLDLTKVQEASSKINGLIQAAPIAPDISMKAAATISSLADLNKSAIDSAAPTTPSQVIFEQNNYSPKALSVNDIYRNTKSQIAVAKEELGIS